MSLFTSMNIGVRGLSSSQLALNVTSQNISNANTEGYSRKRLNLNAEYRKDPNFGQMGFGVEVSNITRIRDYFIDQQINRQEQERGYYNELENALTRIENIFGEPSDTSLSTVMDEFWNGWADLSNNPESIAARNVVKANAEVLTDTMHNLSKEIRDLKDSKNDDIVSTVNQVNELLGEIYQLNREISIAELSSTKMANDARDARDLAIKNLSKLINVTTEDAGNGVLSVLTNGNMLVSPSNFVELETTTDTFQRPDGTTFNSLGIRFSSTKESYKPLSGKLKGVLDARDEVIPYYEDKLDEIANTLVEEVNSLHRQGFSLNGISGIDFFKVNTHEELVKAHTEIVDGYSFAYDPVAGFPQTIPLNTPNIVSNSMVLKRADNGAVIDPSDYTVNLAAGSITLTNSGSGSIPTVLPVPNLTASYSYDVPKGYQTVEETYASNIELSAAIKQDVINIAAASGQTSYKYSETITGPAVGTWAYVKRSAGMDGIYNTADDIGTDGLPNTADDLREQSSIVKGTVTISQGTNVLEEEVDYHIDYSTGRIMILNASYAGSNLSIEYEASDFGSDGYTDNKNAVAISELRHTKVMADDFSGNPTATMNTFYSSFIGELGIAKNSTTANKESREFLVQEFEARQAEISGVSLDEELANLVKYQHTYQASARIITTAEKMLDILLNL